jgi:hypothetical protein
MPTTGIESVLNRAMSDSTFADQLFASPDQALAGFELTTEEAASLKSMSRAEFDRFAIASPEERKSFSKPFVFTKLMDKSSPKL